MSEPAIDLAVIESERARLRAAHLRPAPERPGSSARGLHHVACLSSDVERTIRFYQDLLEFPLTDLFENRDYRGSNHFFFDIGNGNLLAFFDFPGLDLGPYAEVLGGLHHIAISVPPDRWERLKAKLDAAGVAYQLESGTSIYFRDPDGVRLELIADPLGEMYGTAVLQAGVEPGLRAAFGYTVTEADTAVAVGSGDVPVLATPRVLALAERATVAAVAGALEPGQTTVGARVELDHLAPSRVGAELEVAAVLEEVAGRRLRFAVNVREGDRPVAGGQVTRVVVDAAAFLGDAGG